MAGRVKQLLRKDKDFFHLVYRKVWWIVSICVLAVPTYLIIAYIHSPTKADSNDEPYSIFILAGQSLAAGVNSYRTELEPGNSALDNCTSDPNMETGTDINQRCHPADFATDFWWAGSNGQGVDAATWQAFSPELRTFMESIFPDTAGDAMNWAYSSNTGGSATEDTAVINDSSKRLQNNLNGTQVVHATAQASGLFGSEFGIARQLYNMGRRKVIILKVTYGFQSLAQSDSPLIPFDWNVNSTSAPGAPPKSYTQLKNQLNQLTSYLQSTGKKYTVDGIFWMQGETDTLQNEYAAAYQQNLEDLVSHAKQDLKLHPYGHFVIGKSNMNYCIINSWPREGNYCDYPSAASIAPPSFVSTYLDYVINPIMSHRNDQVRAAQQAVADEDQATTQKVDIFETGDLPRGYDFTHLTAPGQIQLGKRFVTMYKLPFRDNSHPDDYDQDGVTNGAEDSNNNGNLGDDDADHDGYPNYLDKINGPGSGL